MPSVLGGASLNCEESLDLHAPNFDWHGELGEFEISFESSFVLEADRESESSEEVDEDADD